MGWLADAEKVTKALFLLDRCRLVGVLGAGASNDLFRQDPL
jgi:hypothetical protein